MKLGAAIVAGLFLTALSLPLVAQDPATIWRIGSFDRSSAEFADGSPDRPVVFVIHQSVPAKDWYAYAPAYFSSRKPELASAPRTIQFSLDSKPASAYRLRVSLVIEHSSVPALRVAINGHAGVFYLHPTLDYSMGDTTAAYFPAYSHAAVDVDFPAGYLQPGTNTITLQAIATQDKGVPDAGYVYDAVELNRIASLAAAPALRVEPTIFYKQHGNTLSERVDVFVRYAGHPRPGQVDIEVAGKRYHQPLHSERGLAHA